MQATKPVYTERITVSIEVSLRDDLNFLTDELNINRSALIRDLILEWMISRKLIFQSADREPSSPQMKDAIGYSIEVN